MLYLRAVLMCIVVFLPLIIINGFQALGLVLKIFSRKTFRRYQSFWADFYWSYMIALARAFGGIRYTVMGDSLPKGENALVLANHQSTVDTIAQLMLAHQHGRLGHCKFFAKDILKWVPGPGWGLTMLECLFLKRSWAEDETRIMAQLKRFSDENVPVWVNIYPEGTRIKPKKLAAAQKFAQEQGMPLPQHVLIPRTRGFHAVLDGLSDHLQAVYDLTFFYPKGIPSLWDLIAGHCGPVELRVRRFPLASLPLDKAARTQWLLDLYREKDALLESLQQAASSALGYTPLASVSVAIAKS